MPNFNIIKQSCPKKTFRVANVCGTYDLQTENICEQFSGSIDLPEKWNIGLIVGRSGTGKTTIAKELFSDKIYTCGENYTHECLLDDFPADAEMKDIYKALVSVGFSSAPSWLKPYSVLSNGEKMRCDIARALIQYKDSCFVFDEFTSVVDRDVAKVTSYAVQKAIRRQDSQFIAVTCHHDVQQWLMPDWVFNTDEMKFSILDVEEQKKNRPRFNIDIYETSNKEYYWTIFKKYHYLSHNFNKAARVFVCTCDGKIAGFCAVLPFPHPKLKNRWRGHRTVVLPDYQGVSIGSQFTSFIAELFKKEGKVYISTTSNPAMIFARVNDKKWKTTRISRTSTGGENSLIQNKHKKGSTSSNRITVAFEYIGEIDQKTSSQDK